jgi:hypothetical protein
MTDEMRASDADRQRVMDALHRHTADGRLTLDEFSERADVVYAARTLGELAAVTRDLPPPTPAPALQTTVDSNARQLAIAFVVAITVLVALGLLMTLR